MNQLKTDCTQNITQFLLHSKQFGKQALKLKSTAVESTFISYSVFDYNRNGNKVLKLISTPIETNFMS